MAGLVGYDSSDEDEDVEVEGEVKEVPKLPEAKPLQSSQDTPKANPQGEPSRTTGPAATPPKAPEDEKPSIIGPMLQPAESSNPIFPPLEDAPAEDEPPALPPGSPYTATRTILRDLTLPAVPNMEIPPSPPGSPPAGTNKKFEQFLELKKKGVHFNSKIAQSSALRNPGLTDKLLAFVDIDQAAQYRTTLAPALWDPAAFPREAYKEQLRLSQTEIAQARARGKGAPVEFVAGAAAAGAGTSRETTPAGTQKGGPDGSVAHGPNPGKRKTRFET